MGGPSPSPPIINSVNPVWDYVLDYYLNVGRIFEFTANQASRFFLYLNGILVSQSSPNVTSWSYTFPSNPEPSSTPNTVRAVVQNSNGSTEHIWNWVVTPTEVAAKPILQKVNPTGVQLPDIPSDTAQPLVLTVSVDQWSTLTLKIDGQVFGSPKNVSTPNSEVTFTIGTDYLNNPQNIGEHTIAINAENSNGVSDSALVYTWKLVCRSDCLPSGNVINFQFDQYRIYNNEWSSWKTAHCNENAIARFGYGSQEKSQFSNDLSKIEWRKNNGTCQKCNVSFYKATGPNQKLFLVSSSRNGHAMVAEYSGRDDTQEHFEADRQLWANWRFFQYDQENIQPAQYVNPSNPQMPRGPPDNFITIRQVTSIYFTQDGTPKYVGTTVAQFRINENNDKDWNYPFAEFEY